MANYDGAFTSAVAVTPNDTDALSDVPRGLWIGGAGNIAVVTLSDQTITFNSVPAGSLLPVRVKKVLATGTTATNILSLR